MQHQSSVLAHLALRFSPHPENVATEALCFILKSAAAGHALQSFVAHLGGAEVENLRFETQEATESGSRPDIIGKDSGGNTWILLEAKYWAGLTDAQPVDYLKRLPEAGGVLLFVAPSQRIDSLWIELLHRVHGADMASTSGKSHVNSDNRFTKLGNRVLALTSWRTLLACILGGVEAADDRPSVSNVQQLAALCEEMDSVGFVPMSSEELTSTIGRRIIQFGKMASDLTDRLVSDGYASVQGLRAAGANGKYGRYLRLKGAYGSYLHFNADRWTTSGKSPIWLGIGGSDFKRSSIVDDAIVKAGILDWSDISASDNNCYVPIYLTSGTVLDELLESATAQLHAIIRALPVIEPDVVLPPPALDDSLT
jgi:hypothetical protein